MTSSSRVFKGRQKSRTSCVFWGTSF